ncbi:hypothetical protein Avbf_13472 [Armadillidium vulgare]|nr:hypothetical protein Avbf_13472 [Armadillidium vulgare]
MALNSNIHYRYYVHFSQYQTKITLRFSQTTACCLPPRFSGFYDKQSFDFNDNRVSILLLNRVSLKTIHLPMNF